ncbi:hypothetical protein AYL99_00448 [Fonsecaea erecta]|uniref:Zn(2)-C6 fungal-type domain-containing protein n=1 Tax=Fonsecaea erecta TaxID=1367422 RepID=A0A178ZYG1_9EURO|nr:hypothetical protein AYL99_00448 [Fonsecaea erecta]OAP64476.1 hypothetical protein AYL99_00448 [Fonsecaea erecta]
MTAHPDTNGKHPDEADSAVEHSFTEFIDPWYLAIPRQIASSQTPGSTCKQPEISPSNRSLETPQYHNGMPNIWDALLDETEQQLLASDDTYQDRSLETSTSVLPISSSASHDISTWANETSNDASEQRPSNLALRRHQQSNVLEREFLSADATKQPYAAQTIPKLRHENSETSSSGWDSLPEFDLATHSDDSQTLLVDIGTNSSPLRSLKRPSDTESADAWDSREDLMTGGGVVDQQQSKRARRDKTLSELAKVLQVRKESACIRCQVLKESCGPGLPCLRCQEVGATATIWRTPCFKGRITDVKLFRDMALSFPDGVRRVDSWKATPKVKISLYNVGYGRGQEMEPSRRPTISVICQAFTPLPTDTLGKKYVRGDETVTILLPAYAIPGRYLKRTMTQLLATVERNWSMLANELELGQDELIAASMKEALRIHDQSPCVHDAITLCIMTRLLSKSFNLHGKESLGIATVDDPMSPYFGRKPIPPFLDAQIDQMWMQLLSKVKKRLLSELKRKIMGRKKEDWYQIFLSLIILIANLEFVYSVQNDQLRRYCLKMPRSSFPFGSISLMEAWEHGAKNLLTHFRVIFNGTAPFTIDPEEQETWKAMKLDASALAYLQHMQGVVAKRADELSAMRKRDPGEALVWVSGLFLPIADDDL